MNSTLNHKSSTITIKEIFNANNLRQVLARYAKLLGSTRPAETNGVIIPRYVVVQIRGKLIIKNEKELFPDIELEWEHQYHLQYDLYVEKFPSDVILELSVYLDEVLIFL